MIRLAVFGAGGRAGGRVCALAATDERFGAVVPIGRDDATPPRSPAGRTIDGIIDFSSVSGTRRAAGLAREQSAALLVATTALDAEVLAELDAAAADVPVMVAPNTSRGVAVLRRLAVEAVRELGKNFSIDVLETHHRHKRDAPSGTALALVDDLVRRAGVDLPAERVHSIRAGDVVGEHEVLLAGPGETIRLAHAATTRDVFAHGALDALAWLVGRPPGRYEFGESVRPEPPRNAG